MSKLDHLYRRILLTKFFVRGWGKPDNLKKLFEFRRIISDREKCRHLVSADYPIHIDKETVQKECRIITGHFTSPFVHHVPGIMPKEVEKAHFQMILPREWKTKHKPVCLHLAGTGDHAFWRRRLLMARPLVKEAGIGSIILENPYYGVRKPKQQVRSCLHNVSDLFVMGGALVVESLALLHWCERQGFGPLGITGISMGGFMASLAATNWHKPLALIPCLSWSTASSVFTRGVMTGAIPWKLLQDQYSSDTIYAEEISKLIVSPEEMRKDRAFQLGCDFAKQYPESVETMQQFQDKFYSGVHDTATGSDFLSVYNDNPSANNINQTSSSPANNLNLAPNESGSGSSSSSNSASHTACFHTSSVKDSLAFLTRLRINKNSKVTDATVRNLKETLRIGNAASIFKNLKSENKQQVKNMQREALMFMRGLMDECTHLANFTCPLDPSLIIIVAAKKDAYVPRDSVLSLEELWPGSEVRYINSGHISAFLFSQDVFRKAIADAFDRHIQKYDS